MINSLRNRVIIILMVIACFQISFSYNHSEITWKTIKSKHFDIHYYDKTEPFVYAAWRIAESSYDALDHLYNRKSKKKIHIALADYDDYTNGYAAWLQQSIMVWVPDMRFDLRSSNTWLRNVIAHELGHIMSMEKKSAMQIVDIGLSLQYLSPNFNAQYRVPIPMMNFFPNWFAEGTAQLSSERSDGDSWDSRRDMILRCGLIENKMLTLDEMANFTHTGIQNEMIYNQGYAFTAYLEDKLGIHNVAKIWNTSRGLKFGGENFNKYMQRTFGFNLKSEFERFKKVRLKEAQEKIKGNITKSEPIWGLGIYNGTIRMSPDGKFVGWLTSDKDDYSRTDLIIANTNDFSVVSRIKHAHTDWDFSADSKKVYYINSRAPNKNGSFLNDLFEYDYNSKKTKKLTSSARVYNVTSASDGNTLYVVRFSKGIYSLQTFNISTNKFTVLYESKLGEPILSLDYGDDALILSKMSGGNANLYLYSCQTDTLKPVVATDNMEEDPYWGSDNRIYFSADYEGIHNIYSVDLQGQNLLRHTSVVGGAFSPRYTTSGSIIFSEYNADGFKIVQSIAPSVSYAVSLEYHSSFTPLPKPTGRVEIQPSVYNKKMLRPIVEIFGNVALIDNDKVIQNMVNQVNLDDSLFSVHVLGEIGIVAYKSDALFTKDRYFAAGIFGNYDKYGDTSSVADSLYADHAIMKLRPKQASTKRNLFVENRAKSRIVSFSNKINESCGIRTNSDSTDSRTSSLYSSIGLMGGLSNYENKPSFGFDAQIILFQMIPYALFFEPYITLQMHRDIHIGFSALFNLYPILLLDSKLADGFFSTTMPLWLQWSTTGYHNEDFSYNYGGVSLVQLYAGPTISPVISVDIINEKEDTSLVRTTSFDFGLYGAHYFPILKYASFGISADFSATALNNDMNISIGDLDYLGSNFYLRSVLQTRLTIPIFRNINKGQLFCDNLYGSIFYTLDLESGGGFIKNSSKDIFINPDYENPYADISHVVGVSLIMGTIKQYMFERSIKVNCSGDIFKKLYKLDISFGF